MLETCLALSNGTTSPTDSVLVICCHYSTTSPSVLHAVDKKSVLHEVSYSTILTIVHMINEEVVLDLKNIQQLGTCARICALDICRSEEKIALKSGFSRNEILTKSKRAQFEEMRNTS